MLALMLYHLLLYRILPLINRQQYELSFFGIGENIGELPEAPAAGTGNP
jgi:hypothetical protein